MTRISFTLKKECPATEIPSGYPVTLPVGTHAVVTQALGDSITLAVDGGSLVRVEPEHVSKLGKKVAGLVEGAAAGKKSAKKSTKTKPLEELVLDELKTCYDPEIPVNIVDLGLIYKYTIKPARQGGMHVLVKFTLTAPGCGMGPVLKQEIEKKLRRIPTVTSSYAQMVFEPAWDQRRMSDAAKLQLGML
jgi:probable FeS assembly SUF system protein SufT